MKNILILALLSVLPIYGFGQNVAPDFVTTPVNKQIREFPDVFDLGSPLNSCVSFNYLIINGKNSRIESASTERYTYGQSRPVAPDVKVSEKTRNYYLNLFIVEIIRYKDSIAGAIGRYADANYSIRFLSLENGRWVNAGEDAGTSLDDARDRFTKKAGRFYGFLERIKILDVPPANPRALADFLKVGGREPKDYVLQALAEHRLVIYGEVHRRQWSWDFCRSVINDRSFPDLAGTIFLEISAHSQRNLDLFLSKDTMDRELILDALRDIQIYGWHDRGMFEFILEVWKLNKTLPLEKRIKLVAADYPRPFSQFKTHEELDRYFSAASNRNAFMADKVETTLRSNRDGRHGIFIVGCGHAYKSTVPGYASSWGRSEESLTAGALLSARLPKGDVFILFSHTVAVSNDGRIRYQIRKGAFDAAFRLNGNTPVAFDLAHGPFGQEPIDAFSEMAFDPRVGTFADNYDGYIFLGPWEREPSDYILYELYSDDFVKELNRRAIMEKTPIQDWFEVKSADKESIVAQLKNEHEGKKRWVK